MRTIALIITIMMLTTWAWASELGFKGGNSFQTLKLTGSGHIYCPSSGERLFISCNFQYLDPTEMDYFTYGQELDADRVKLTAYREDGSTRSKARKYRSSKGQSTKRFNLWIQSLFQRPLLKMGVNTIAVEMSKNGAVVAADEFVATVVEGESRHCPYQTVIGRFDSDCESAYLACERYFRLLNYCQ
ncbi:MAG: hypothetical protein HN353_07310 [Bdellovibrionales bacterium]|jgi:hypothetical protein|nr:hypothetical protein [Bdellovibrionales bacterium]MBT3526618.1 hypothetical protein [Bdellovibrionales bacterium]MBT7670613.1 hypothetical protein [Bdellovibrionales bacterium]MBT7766724.1 hypothetical protein [Bdellovibrionales bacterium]